MVPLLKKILLEGCQEIGISLDDKQVNLFLTYLDFLQKKNQEMNLTAIKEEEEIVVKHFLDSLLAVQALKLMPGVSLIDIGTGAGFPGVPLKIFFPQLKLTLLDSLRKRINFLEDLCQLLGFTDVSFIHGRAEDFGRQKSYREKYNYVVSRAVAELNILAEYCLPLVKVGGHFLALKGPLASEEINKSYHALEVLGGDLEEIVSCSLPLREDKRNLVLIKKNKSTPKLYPRKAGTPSKNPL